MHMRPAVGAGTLRTAIRPPTGLPREPATWTKDRSGPSSLTVTSRLLTTSNARQALNENQETDRVPMERPFKKQTSQQCLRYCNIV